MSKIFFRFLLILSVAIGILSCTRTPHDLTLAEQLMETAPDSALHILQRFQSQKLTRASDKAYYALLMSQALDKNDIKSESDSLIAIATGFYNESDALHAGYAWFYRARIDNNRGNMNDQAKSLIKAQDYAVNVSGNKLLGMIYCDKAGMYENQQQYDSAICYFKKAYTAFNSWIFRSILTP